MARADLLQLPTGDRLALVRAAKQRAMARLKVAHRHEYELLLEDELANPPRADVVQPRWP